MHTQACVPIKLYLHKQIWPRFSLLAVACWLLIYKMKFKGQMTDRSEKLSFHLDQKLTVSKCHVKCYISSPFQNLLRTFLLPVFVFGLWGNAQVTETHWLGQWFLICVLKVNLIFLINRKIFLEIRVTNVDFKITLCPLSNFITV